MLEITEKGIYRVEDQDIHVRGLTEAGWQLVAVLQDSELARVIETLVIPPLPGQSFVNTQNIEKQYPVSKTKYLLVKNEMTALWEVQTELKAALERLGKETKEFNEYKKKAEGAAKEHETLVREHHEICQGYQRIDKEFKQYKAETEAKLKEAEAKLKEAALAIEKYGTIRKTAYEHVLDGILEGTYDERVESLEARDFGDGCDPVADLPEGPGVQS
jgi:hypothetical protein